MIGYHYTLGKTWELIKQEGLVPQVPKRSPFGMFSRIQMPPEATWLFVTPTEGEFETRAQIFYTLLKRGDVQEDVVVELMVEYEEWHLAPFYKEQAPGDVVEIGHTGRLATELGGVQDEIIYHENKPSVILTRTVEPEYIWLNRAWRIVTPLHDLTQVPNAPQSMERRSHSPNR